MPNGDKIRPKNTREHLLAIYGYITGSIGCYWVL